MNKRSIFVIVSLILIAIVLSVYIYKNSSTSAGGNVRQNSGKTAQRLYSEADKMMKEGKIADACNLYKKIISECSGSSLVSASRAQLDDLNIKVLFSPIPAADSTLYEVMPGDTLGKIAKNFGTTVELIMKSNALQSTVIRPGTKLKVSKAKYSILVDKSQNILILKADGEAFKTYTVATGKDNSTPIGTYQIKEKLTNPTWYKAGAVVPPDSPDNILGTRWMALTLDHYGIHGTTDETTLGQQVTAGCVRMKNKDVEELYTIVPAGTEVTIID
ncbi:MAG: L,D-transpeptidase family protein [Candidatus Omnitrophica bacterium]|nr:L,D-transpeptidase family protein [Candidatus Omnitrophota bacterium]